MQGRRGWRNTHGKNFARHFLSAKACFPRFPYQCFHSFGRFLEKTPGKKFSWGKISGYCY
jgi:hypothetical protein